MSLDAWQISFFENTTTNTAPAPWVPDEPFNALPLLPPATELETKPVLKQCVLAHAALAALRQAAELFPNQTMLINTIPLLEAKDSSEIENIVTTTDRLFQFAQADDGTADAATKEALRYRNALYAGFQSLATRPISTSTAVEICRTIKAVDMDVRRVAGTQLANATTGEIAYTPPMALPSEDEAILTWELKRDGTRRGIVEVTEA